MSTRGIALHFILVVSLLLTALTLRTFPMVWYLLEHYRDLAVSHRFEKRLLENRRNTTDRGRLTLQSFLKEKPEINRSLISLRSRAGVSALSGVKEAMPFLNLESITDWQPCRQYFPSRWSNTACSEQELGISHHLRGSLVTNQGIYLDGQELIIGGDILIGGTVLISGSSTLIAAGKIVLSDIQTNSGATGDAPVLSLISLSDSIQIARASPSITINAISPVSIQSVAPLSTESPLLLTPSSFWTEMLNLGIYNPE